MFIYVALLVLWFLGIDHVPPVGLAIWTVGLFFSKSMIWAGVANGFGERFDIVLHQPPWADISLSLPAKELGRLGMVEAVISTIVSVYMIVGLFISPCYVAIIAVGVVTQALAMHVVWTPLKTFCKAAS